MYVNVRTPPAMPHITIEHSANLDGRVDMQAFCRVLLKSALATGVFETGAVRVRAIRCDHYAIADEAPENGFIDVSLRLAAGRDLALRKSVGDALFMAMTEFLAPEFAAKHFALSFEVREIDPKLSYKKNAIHDRLRA
jgi:5-carboxymethyl-2-hydroxymuconate isomerase